MIAPQRLRLALAIMVVVLAAPLALHAYAGTFSRYLGDDYCDAAIFRREGLVGAQKYFYDNWGAVPTTIVAMALTDPGGLRLARMLPALALSAWVALLAWAVYPVTTRLARYGRWLLALCFAELVVFATIEDAPNVIQSIYLRIPMLAYTCPIVGLSAYAGFCVRAASRTASTPRLVASGLIAFVVGSFGPVYVAMQTTLLVLAEAAAWRSAASDVRRNVVRLLGAGVIGSLLSLALIAAAPGNTARSRFFPPRPGPTYVAKATVLATGFFLARPVIGGMKPLVAQAVPHALPQASAYLDRALAMTTSPVMPITMVIFGVVLALIGPPRGDWSAAISPRALIAIPIAAFVLVAAAIVVGPFGTSAPPPPRALIIPQFVLECLAVAWGWFAGVRVRIGDRGGFDDAVVPSLVAAVVLLVAVQSAISTRRTMALVPSMRAWAATWDANDRALRAAAAEGRLDATVTAMPPLGGVGSIAHDPADWVNDCAAQYYRLRTVTGR